jgi:hypothetical protein
MPVVNLLLVSKKEGFINNLFAFLLKIIYRLTFRGLF